MCQKKNRLKNCNETDEPLSYSHGALDSPNRDSIVLRSRKIWDTTKRWGRTRSWLGAPRNRRRHCQSVAATCNLVSMPELPDISAYISALESRILGQPLEHIRLNSAFLLRTAQPPLARAEGRMVRGLRRIGKRIVIGVDNDVWLALHLMIAGRLHWQEPERKLAGRRSMARFVFPHSPLVRSEGGTKQPASLHVLQGKEIVGAID